MSSQGELQMGDLHFEGLGMKVAMPSPWTMHRVLQTQ